MTTKRSIAANRRNAEFSTGPKSPAGKVTVSRNALKHGLLANDVLLPNENPEELTELSERLRGEYKPVGVFESVLVDDIISHTLRLRRFRKIEAGILSWRYRETLDDSIKMQFLPAESEQRLNIEVLGEAFVRDCREGDALSKLSRYETSIERSRYKAVHELQRHQAARQGQPVPLPVAVDVNVSGTEDLRNDHDARAEDSQSYEKPGP